MKYDTIKTLKQMCSIALSIAIVSQFSFITNAAGAITTVTYKDNTNLSSLTDSAMKKIAASTPNEPASSDLEVIQPATRIATKRLPQSYTHDGKYYYYLSNLCNTGSKKNSLRLTRVKYTGFGTYTESYMTLVNFGHGSGIDCTTVNGKTYLWVGSNYQKDISCFKFKAGKTIKKHATVHFSIPINGTGSNATNLSPALSPDGKTLVVRFKRNGKQQFQYYKVTDGKKINPRKPKKIVKLPSPKQTFQGFDVKGSYIYTVEGSRSESECKEIHETYYPIVVRTYNTKTSECVKKQKIKGAAKLLHREPEGIRVEADGEIQINICSHYKDKYTCPNIYRVK